MLKRDEKSNRIPDNLFQKLTSKKNSKQKVEVGLIEGFEILSALNREHSIAIEYLTKKVIIKRRIDYSSMVYQRDCQIHHLRILMNAASL